jgi:hypothetical protein
MCPPTIDRWTRPVHDAPSLSCTAAASSDDFERLRRLCRGLIDDLPAVTRHELALRILHATTRAELWQLRPEILRALALRFSEAVALERLQQMDARRS